MKSEITKEYIRKNCVMSTTTTTKSNNFDKQVKYRNFNSSLYKYTYINLTSQRSSIY